MSRLKHFSSNPGEAGLATVLSSGLLSGDYPTTTSYTIRLPSVYTEGQALRIAESIIDDRHRQGNLVNAVSFFFYFPGTDPRGAADGSIDWAPNGNWAEANSVRTGDYRTFRFETQFYRSGMR